MNNKRYILYKKGAMIFALNSCNLPIKEVQPKAFHGRRTIIAERTRFNHIVLTDMLVLKVSAHCNLSLETSVTYRAMVWQSF